MLTILRAKKYFIKAGSYTFDIQFSSVVKDTFKIYYNTSIPILFFKKITKILLDKYSNTNTIHIYHKLLSLSFLR